MSTSSVQTVCPCGDTFERPIQRGRPAIWCPKCRELPLAKRPPVPAEGLVVNADGEEIEVTPQVSRFGSHDVLNYTQRERIEAGVAEVYARHRVSRMEDEEMRMELVKVYHAVDPDKWPLR